MCHFTTIHNHTECDIIIINNILQIDFNYTNVFPKKAITIVFFVCFYRYQLSPVFVRYVHVNCSNQRLISLYCFLILNNIDHKMYKCMIS